MDSSSLRFLTASALEARRKEEEEEEQRRRELEEAEERMLELNRRISADLPLTQADTEAWRRWILLPRRPKKRRKKKLPRGALLLVPVMYMAFHFVTFLATMVFVRTCCSHREICFFFAPLFWQFLVRCLGVA